MNGIAARVDDIYSVADLAFAAHRGDLERRLHAERDVLAKTIARVEAQEIEPLRRSHLEVRVRQEAVTKLIEKRAAERQAKIDAREAEQLDLAGVQRFIRKNR